MNIPNFPSISLFTGAGGLDLGLESAGFQTRVCVEIDQISCKTLHINRPNWRIINKDINTVSTDEILNMADLKRGEPALVSGGPPCQSFSNMGNGKGINDHRGRLFYEFVRVIEEAQPKAFLMENVPGLASSDNGEVIKIIMKEFERIGYTTHKTILNSADYGVPQKRRRIIILGTNTDLPIEFPTPTHSERMKEGLLPWVSIGETLSKITHEDLQRPDNRGFNHRKDTITKMSMIPPGGNFRNLPDQMKPNCWKTGKHQGQDTFGRLELNKPSVTIRTSAYNPTKGRYIHPTENRGLNTIEMAFLQTFPRDYIFKGSLVQIGTQIGNAVPPLMAKNIGESILSSLNKSLISTF